MAVGFVAILETGYCCHVDAIFHSTRSKNLLMRDIRPYCVSHCLVLTCEDVPFADGTWNLQTVDCSQNSLKKLGLIISQTDILNYTYGVWMRLHVGPSLHKN